MPLPPLPGIRPLPPLPGAPPLPEPPEPVAPPVDAPPEAATVVPPEAAPPVPAVVMRPPVPTAPPLALAGAPPLAVPIVPPLAVLPPQPAMTGSELPPVAVHPLAPPEPVMVPIVLPPVPSPAPDENDEQERAPVERARRTRGAERVIFIRSPSVGVVETRRGGAGAATFTRPGYCRDRGDFVPESHFASAVPRSGVNGAGDACSRRRRRSRPPRSR